MKSIKPTKIIQKNEQTNTFIQIIKNINEIDLSSIKNKKKRSFPNLNYIEEDDNSNLLKLFKRLTLDDEYKNKQLERNNSFNFGNNSLKRQSNIFKENTLKNKLKKNFILKSDLFNNKNEGKAKSPNLDNRDNTSNNCINLIHTPKSNLETENKIQNISNFNNIEEPNNKTQDNIIPNYHQNYKNDIYSERNLNNNFNYNENKANDIKKPIQNVRNVNSINDNVYNNNYNYYNYNNIYYGNTLPSQFPQNYNYNINNNFTTQINNNQNINNNQYINNNDLSNDNIIYLSKTLQGCQILKNKIISDSKYANEILFPNIIHNLKEICTNIFGNSMIQTLLGVLTFENIDLFLFTIKNQITEICLSESGSRVMQALIGKIKNNPFLMNKLIFYLNNDDLKSVFKSAYGHHFIKYYLFIINDKEFTNFIYIFICNNFIEIATDKFGVTIIQRAFGAFDGEELNKLFKLTEQNCNLLMKDCFGNYLIQYIFIKLKNKFQFNTLFPLIKKITENLVDFCKDKFSSSALEKIFEQGEEKIKEYLINYLIKFYLDEIIYILIHPNGFYVIKKAMYINNKDIKTKIVKAIIKNKYKIESGSQNELVINSFCDEFSDFC